MKMKSINKQGCNNYLINRLVDRNKITCQHVNHVLVAGLFVGKKRNNMKTLVWALGNCDL